MTYYVYFLRSARDSKLYIGRTNNVGRRFAEHNAGMVRSTKGRRPLQLLGFDQCESEIESVRLEREWKKSHKREELKRRFKI